MTECENLAKCPFYQGKMAIENGIGSMYKRKYCMGNKSDCARYMVASKLGKEFVPQELYPNMVDKAREIIAKNAK